MVLLDIVLFSKFSFEEIVVSLKSYAIFFMFKRANIQNLLVKSSIPMLQIIYILLRFADIDECATRPGLCRNGTCVNEIGGHTCFCDRGFSLTDNNDCFGTSIFFFFFFSRFYSFFFFSPVSSFLPLPPKSDILGMKLHGIRWWGNNSGALRNMMYSFITIIPWSTMTRCSSSC